jgi:hypothetical protein
MMMIVVIVKRLCYKRDVKEDVQIGYYSLNVMINVHVVINVIIKEYKDVNGHQLKFSRFFLLLFLLFFSPKEKGFINNIKFPKQKMK